MTDLSASIEGQTPEEIARYFKFDVDRVKQAIKMGCKTYQEVYDLCKPYEVN